MLAIKSINRFLKLHITNKTYQEKLKFGQNINAMLIDCLFNTAPCHRQPDELNFQLFFSFDQGLCYKFNPEKLNPIKTRKNGWRGGLQLELYVGNASNEYFNNKRGIRVLVQNNTHEIPELEDYGIDVPTGFQTNIAVKRTFYERKPWPYSNRVNDLSANYSYQTETMKSMFEMLDITHYSQKLCNKFYFNRVCAKRNWTFFFSKIFVQAC